LSAGRHDTSVRLDLKRSQFDWQEKSSGLQALLATASMQQGNPIPYLRNQQARVLQKVKAVLLGSTSQPQGFRLRAHCFST
jgi:hypothetical protein